MELVKTIIKTRLEDWELIPYNTFYSKFPNAIPKTFGLSMLVQENGMLSPEGKKIPTRGPSSGSKKAGLGWDLCVYKNMK